MPAFTLDQPDSQSSEPSDTGTVHAPPGVFQGWDALDKLAGELRDSHPDFKYTPKGEPQVLQDAGIIAWDSGPSANTPVYSGLDVIIARGDRISSLYVFLNPKLA